MSVIKVDAIQTAAGVEKYLAGSWVNFDGTGVVAIRASGNVSSLMDDGTGTYATNFTTAMSDTNYSVVGSGGDLVSGSVVASRTLLAGSCGIRLTNTTASYDNAQICVVIFR